MSGLFDFSPSLTVISFCPRARRVSLVVRVVFAEGEVDLGRLEFVRGPSV